MKLNQFSSFKEKQEDSLVGTKSSQSVNTKEVSTIGKHLLEPYRPKEDILTNRTCIS